jgi:signal transduction histidine kinase
MLRPRRQRATICSPQFGGAPALDCLMLIRITLAGWLAVLGAFGCAAKVEAGGEGVPLTRLYSLEEIGCTSQGLQLLRDPYGRVAVEQQGEFFVLNDTTWQKTVRDKAGDLSFGRIVADADGEIYYGVFGSWGVLRKNERGDLRPVPLVPADAPAWVRQCYFCDILCVQRGVFIWGQDGVVYLDKTSGGYSYFPIGRVSWLFPFEGKFIVGTFGAGMYALDIAAGTWTPAAIGMGEFPPVVASAGNGVASLLLATTNRQLLALREGKLGFVRYGDAEFFPGPVVAVTALAEGGFAAAVAGYGVLLLDQDGVVQRVFDAVGFRSVTALSSMEPGVLWAVTERGVLKILHGQPFTAFGRDQGLPVSWPQIVWWRGRTIISSGGRVFESYSTGAEGRGRFRYLPGQPDNIGWGIASFGDTLLIGNGQGVYEANEAGDFSLVYAGVNAARLVLLDADTCLAIATDAIQVLRRQGGAWAECAPRLPGVGYPYVTHNGNGAAWIELGSSRVARIALVGDRLQLRLFEKFDWDERSWVNVSVVGSTVAFCASGHAPMFLDDRTLESADSPELRGLVSRSPYIPQRFVRDDAGNLWVSHARGLFLARWVDGRYESDFDAFRGINEATPLVQCPAGGAVWASRGTSLYRLEHQQHSPVPIPARPLLVALRDTRSGTQLHRGANGARDLGAFRYAQNSLQLDFCAGSYALVRPFSYEYRLGASAWVRANAASSVILTDLHEGAYTLEVRITDPLGPVGAVAAYRLSVEAPWYRSWIAFVCYPFGAVMVIYLATLYAAYRNRVRLADLEREVGLRTAELRTAMDCLREEATANATLAERNRLAGEIHDSLEQGFAGLFLQLETISRLPTCAGAVKAGLTAAVNMVSYCRDELRNAVRGLHSPILQSEPLEAALKRIIGQLAPLAGLATLRIEGSPRRIDPATEHHLLRIVQEALGNTVKHAEATRVEVLLRYSPDGIQLSVVDDGRGFNLSTAAVGEGCHLGLSSFSDRAGKIGGTVEVDSAPGRGTAVRVVVPQSRT